MSCAEAVLAVWLGWAPWHLDSAETREQRMGLYRPVAEAVCRATRDPVERAFLAVQADAETHLARYVLEDRCHDGPVGARCDQGRARGPWQVHRHCRAAWDDSASHASRLESGARCALLGWRWGVRRWDSWAGGFQAQRGLAREPLHWASRRADRMLAVVPRMR